jgi:CxxC-x17-CxxC domain-containing protein
MRKKKEESVEEGTEEFGEESEGGEEAVEETETAESEDTGRSEMPEREMYKIKCSDCGKDAEVPFKPAEGRPVYCRECFMKHRKPRRSFGGGGYRRF